MRYSALGETAIIWLEIKVSRFIEISNVSGNYNRMLMFQLVIKPHSDDGLVLFSGKNDMGDFIAVQLNLGKTLI